MRSATQYIVFPCSSTGTRVKCSFRIRQQEVESERDVPQALEDCGTAVKPLAHSCAVSRLIRPANQGLSFTSKRRMASLSSSRDGLSTSLLRLNADHPGLRQAFHLDPSRWLEERPEYDDGTKRPNLSQRPEWRHAMLCYSGLSCANSPSEPVSNAFLTARLVKACLQDGTWQPRLTGPEIGRWRRNSASASALGLDRPPRPTLQTLRRPALHLSHTLLNAPKGMTSRRRRPE